MMILINRLIFVFALMLLTTLFAARGRKCPPGKTCLYIDVLSMTVPPDGGKCRASLEIRGERRGGGEVKVPAGAQSISLGPSAARVHKAVAEAGPDREAR